MLRTVRVLPPFVHLVVIDYSYFTFFSSLLPSLPPSQIKFIREKVNFKTLIDLRSEKEVRQR